MKRLALAAVLFLLLGKTGVPSPLSVTYTVSGTPGNLTLNFSFANNIVGAPDHALYFLGVLLDVDNVAASPYDFDAVYGTYDPYVLGGSNTTYNNLWLAGTAPTTGDIPGTITPGFEVTIPDAVAPTSVQWFAYTAGKTPYTGGDNFNTTLGGPYTLAGFEGIATEAASAPEPPTMSISLLSVAVLIALRKLRPNSFWQS